MFASNPSSLSFFLSSSSTAEPSPYPSPPRRHLRPTPARRWRSIAIAAAAAAGDAPLGPAFPRPFQYPSVADVAGGFGGRIAGDSADGVAGSGVVGGGIKVSAKEKKWSRSGESYLADDEDALPLPMTYPDTSPVTPEEIDRRLRCDPQIEFHSSYRDMSNISFLDLQYNISKSKLLQRPSRLFSSRDRQSSGLKPAFMPNPDEMRLVFDKFDSNRDGKISQQEYKTVLRALDQGNTAGEVAKIFQTVDLDGDGFISFKEFMDAHKKGGGVRTMDIQSAFRTFDLNGDGKISPEEVLEVLRRLGERCSLDECRRMVRGVDTDGDGLVGMDEFMTMMTNSMQMTLC